jgi:hypothetical protein
MKIKHININNYLKKYKNNNAKYLKKIMKKPQI